MEIENGHPPLTHQLEEKEQGLQTAREKKKPIEKKEQWTKEKRSIHKIRKNHCPVERNRCPGQGMNSGKQVRQE